MPGKKIKINRKNIMNVNDSTNVIANDSTNVIEESISVSVSNERKAISLFSGMGGDTLGLSNAGFDVIAFSENNKSAIETHKLNFPNSVLIGDMKKDKYNIRDIEDSSFSKYNGSIDLIFAGFPCQGFSHAGKKMASDPRNTMFREFARVTKLIKPKYIIGENVEGLLSRKTSSGDTFIDKIKEEFESLGYTIYYQVFNTMRFNVPQLRKRLIIVGIRNDLEQTFEFPEYLNDGENDKPNLKDIIKFSMEGAIKINIEDFDMTEIPEECILTNMENEELEIPENIHPYLKLKAKTRDTEYNDIVHSNLLSFSKRISPIHSEIIDIRNPSKTIICSYDHQPRLYVPLKNKNGYYIRCLLPDELKQIQGFPADYKISGNLKNQIVQIGNAVPPPLVEIIAKRLI